MKMNNIEFVGPASDFAQHGEGAAQMVADPSQSQALGRANAEIRRRFRLPARKQSNEVSSPHKLIREKRHDPLGSAVKFGGDRFREWRDERYPHWNSRVN